MELNNDFRVGVDRDTTWKVLTDLERIAPLLPGAQLQEVDGDEYRGIVKVKVGPIQAQYKGTATMIEADQAAGKMVMKASGRETRGQGNASATITLTMTPDGDGTKVSANTALTISGKVAQFGRGVLADVSSKLIGQFVDNLEADLNAGDQKAGPSSSAPADAVPDQASDEAPVGNADKAGTNGSTGSSHPASAPGGSATTAASGGTDVPSSAEPSGPRRIESPEPEPVDLFDAAGNTMVKRVAPLAGGAVLVLIAVVLRRRRKASRAAKAAAKLNATLSGVRSHASSVSLPDTDALVGAGRKARKVAGKQGRKAGRLAAKQGRQAAASARQVAEDVSCEAAKRGRRAAKRGRRAAAKAQKRASRLS